MWKLWLLLAVVLVISCHKNVPDSPYLRATIRMISNGCSPVVLDFSDDSAAIRSFTGKQDLIWAPKGLPPELVLNGRKVFVKVSDRLAPGEQDICVALWTYYPRIKLLKTKGRN